MYMLMAQKPFRQVDNTGLGGLRKPKPPAGTAVVRTGRFLGQTGS